MRHPSVKWCGGLLVVWLLLSGSVSAQAQTSFTLQLRWVHQFQFAGYYAARELGYYEEAGLDVTLREGVKEDSRQPVEALLAGEVDFAVGNSSVVIERLAGRPLVALAAIMQTSPMVWIVRADSDIHTPLDLPGKRVTLMPPPESAEMLAMLKRESIDLDRLQLVPSSLSIEALIEGRVDAYDGYATNEPWYLEQQDTAYRLIRPRDYGINFYNDVLLTREELVREKAAEVEAFLQASLRGWAWALGNLEEAVDLVHRHYAKDKTREHLLFEASEAKQLIMPQLVQIGHMNPDRWRVIADHYRELGMASGELDMEDFLYSGETDYDLTWLYWLAVAAIVCLCLVSLITMRFASLNRHLRAEAEARRRAERQLKEKHDALAVLASTDALTGLWNRARFSEVAADEIQRARRYDYPVSLLFLDLDEFKRINDCFGHSAGDRVLVDLAELLRGQLRDSDTLGRWGGEEFLVLAPHVGLDEAARLAEKLRQAVAAANLYPEGGGSVSIGVATLAEGESLDALLHRADTALYSAKTGGRNRVECASTPA